MIKEARRPVWAEINLTNLDHNIKNIIKKVGPERKVIGVIKADGYGHGSVKVAEVLRENGVETFAIATLDEAIKLREAGVEEEIIMLGLTPDMYADVIVRYDITPVVDSFSSGKAMSEAAKAEGKTVEGLIAIDTGMGRIGYPVDSPEGSEKAVADIKKICGLEAFKIKGLFSHFATADAADKTYARLQEKRYNAFHDMLKENRINIPMRTFANSAAIMEIPEVYFDAVRPGIILYGCYPSHEVDKAQLDLKPVMSVKANIIKLKKVGREFSVSYGRKFISERESLIATLALGYADGYPRPFSAQAEVIVRGQRAPIAGNICMDQCMVDVTDVPGVSEGDEVIIMGTDGKNTILADEIADATGTINYEIVCAFGQRLPKVYVK